MSGDVVARVKEALAVCICVGDNDDPEMLIRLNDVSALVAEVEKLRTGIDPDISARALAWCKANDGGRLHAKATQMCVSWDAGGYHEIADMYDSSAQAEADIELICDVFNWALEQLAPSTQNYYGTRTYAESPVTCVVHDPDLTVCPVEYPENCCPVHACELDNGHTANRHKCFCGNEWSTR